MDRNHQIATNEMNTGSADMKYVISNSMIFPFIYTFDNPRLLTHFEAKYGPKREKFTKRQT